MTGTTSQKETANNTAGSIAGNAAPTSAAGTSQIQQVIQQQIVNSNVQVNQTANNIVLAGTVPTEADKEKAEQIARQNSGGMTVVNNLQASASASAATGNALPQTSATGTAGASGSTQTAANQTGTAAGETASTGTAETGSSAQTGAVNSGMTAAQTGTPTAGGSMSSDSTLQSQIQTALQNEPTLSNNHLNVNVSVDTIDLSGTVATGKERQTALRIVQSYAGNRRVVDKLTVSGRGQTNTPSDQSNGPQTNPR